MTVRTWQNGVNGFWSTAANWGGTIPGSTDTADFAASPGGPSYSVDVTAAETVGSVSLEAAGAALYIQAGETLTAGAFDLGAGTLSLTGVLQGATVTAHGGTLVANNGTLSAATWRGALVLGAESEELSIANGLALTGSNGTGSGTLDVTGNSDLLAFLTTTTLDGAASGPGLVVGLGSSNALVSLAVAGGATLTLGSHAAISQSASGSESIFNGSGTFVNAGSVGVSGAGVAFDVDTTGFVNNGTIDYAAGAGAEDSVSTFDNAGVISIAGGGNFIANAIGGSLTNTGTLGIDGGYLEIEGLLTGGGTVSVTDAGTAELFGSSNAVSFGDAASTLVLDAPETGSISGFGAAAGGATQDSIEFNNVSSSTSLEPYVGTTSGGTLTLEFGGTAVRAITLLGNYTTAQFSLTPATNNGNSVILTTNEIACFAAGTRISTPRGELPVESLRVGDLVCLANTGRDGPATRPITWVGISHVDLQRHAAPQIVAPIRVRAGAFGRGMPTRDLFLSPDHAIFVAGALIPVRLLANGATISRIEGAGQVAYYHLELDAHDVILAEGLPTESYLDTGNRADFDNGGTVRRLHPFPATAREDGANAAAWNERACAPLVVSGERVDAARAMLRERAALLGFRGTTEPNLRIEFAGRPAAIERGGAAAWRALVPRDARRVRLRTRSYIPDEASASAGDARRLGLPVVSIRLNGRAIMLDEALFERGTHAAEGGWRWTDGDAILRLPPCRGGSMLEIEAAAIDGAYWAEPGDAAAAGRSFAAGHL